LKLPRLGAGWRGCHVWSTERLLDWRVRQRKPCSTERVKIADFSELFSFDTSLVVTANTPGTQKRQRNRIGPLMAVNAAKELIAVTSDIIERRQIIVGADRVFI
jgi:hypothetical protein